MANSKKYTIPLGDWPTVHWSVVTGGGWPPPHPAAGAGVGVAAAPHTEIYPTIPHKLTTSLSGINILLVWSLDINCIEVLFADF